MRRIHNTMVFLMRCVGGVSLLFVAFLVHAIYTSRNGPDPANLWCFGPLVLFFFIGGLFAVSVPYKKPPEGESPDVDDEAPARPRVEQPITRRPVRTQSVPDKEVPWSPQAPRHMVPNTTPVEEFEPVEDPFDTVLDAVVDQAESPRCRYCGSLVTPGAISCHNCDASL